MTVALVRRPIVVLILGIIALAAAAEVQAQLRGGGRSFSNARFAAAGDFDGRFQFCRIEFRNGFGGDARSGEWWVDYPRADINLSIRLSELTKTDISRDSDGTPNHLLVQ